MPGQLRPVIADVCSAMLGKKKVEVPSSEKEALPFITLSRQAGAGAHTLMDSLVKALVRIDPATPPWSGYDREVIDKVTQRHGIDHRRIQKIEEDEPSWLLDIFEGIGSEGRPDPTDLQVYHMLTDTIRRIARGGRAVIIGRGAVFATRDMPGGIHIRLVAPIENRISNMAEYLKISHDEAGVEVRRLDKQRARFFKRFWSIDELVPEHFHMTFNTARMSEAAIIDAILPMIHTVKHKHHEMATA